MMRGQVIGSLIAAVFGAVYVVVNSGSLPTAVSWPLRALAVAAAVLVAFAAVRAARSGSSDATPAPGSTSKAPGTGSPFGRSYWVIVAIEVVALFAGSRVLSGPLDRPQAGVAWVSIVVGVHFFALAVVLRQRFFHVLGAAITACGVLAMVLVFTGADRAVTDLIGGVIPGVILIGFAVWGVRRQVPSALRVR